MPYEHDFSVYPEVFHKYGDNFAKYEKYNENAKNKPAREDLPDNMEMKSDEVIDKSPWEKRINDVLPRYTGMTVQ